MEDEQVRQALDRGCDRRTVADVLGVSRRTTFNKEKRARAYGFPLDAYYNRGGRPTGSGRATRSATATDTTAGESDDQQRLDAVAAHEQEDEQEPDPESRTDAGETPETPESAPDTQSATDTDAEAEAKVGHVEGDTSVDEELRVQLQQALEALQEVNQEL